MACGRHDELFTSNWGRWPLEHLEHLEAAIAELDE
jgi:hypothetical protein